MDDERNHLDMQIHESGGNGIKVVYLQDTWMEETQGNNVLVMILKFKSKL